MSMPRQQAQVLSTMPIKETKRGSNKHQGQASMPTGNIIIKTSLEKTSEKEEEKKGSSVIRVDSTSTSLSMDQSLEKPLDIDIEMGTVVPDSQPPPNGGQNLTYAKMLDDETQPGEYFHGTQHNVNYEPDVMQQ